MLESCRELAELGMHVARVTAARAVADYATPEPPASPEPPVLSCETPEPQALETSVPEPATAETPAAPAAAQPRRGDAVLAFARASRAVRQAIALEARLIAGFAPARPARGPLDPRRATVQRALHDTIQHHPDRRELQRDINESLDHALGAEGADIPTIFASICNDLGITPDLANLPDDILGMDTEPAGHADITDWPAFLAAYYGEEPAPPDKRSGFTIQNCPVPP